MSAPTSTKAFILSTAPSKEVDENNFKLETRDIPALKDDQILVKTVYLSNDPGKPDLYPIYMLRLNGRLEDELDERDGKKGKPRADATTSPPLSSLFSKQPSEDGSRRTSRLPDSMFPPSERATSCARSASARSSPPSRTSTRRATSSSVLPTGRSLLSWTPLLLTLPRTCSVLLEPRLTRTQAYVVALLSRPIDDLNPSVYLGSFGLTGLTAYFGLTKIGEVKKEQTIVISGAAGSFFPFSRFAHQADADQPFPLLRLSQELPEELPSRSARTWSA
jgi:hypothetical protein